MKARALIMKRIKQALKRDVEFNEILRYEISINSFKVTLQRRLPNSAAYMERQKMAVRPLFILPAVLHHSSNTLALGSFTATMKSG